MFGGDGGVGGGGSSSSGGGGGSCCCVRSKPVDGGSILPPKGKTCICYINVNTSDDEKSP